MTSRWLTLIALGGVILFAALLPGRSALGQDSCSAACRVAYGNCYKRNQKRDYCQQQWQRCLEQCRRNKR